MEDEFYDDKIEAELKLETSTEDTPYLFSDVEWVQTTQTKLKELFGEGSVFVFSPNHYKDVGLPTFESMEKILYPGTGKGICFIYVLNTKIQKGVYNDTYFDSDNRILTTDFSL